MNLSSRLVLSCLLSILRVFWSTCLAVCASGDDARQGQHVPFVQYLRLTNVSGPLAGFALSRTGQQLFQRDEDGFLGEDKPMVVSLSEGSPLEALGAMKSRTTYANLYGDSLVGWHTSALEPANVPIPSGKEGAKLKFRHVVHEDYHPGSELSNNEAYINCVNQSDCNTHEISQRLKSLGWERITVSFQVDAKP